METQLWENLFKQIVGTGAVSAMLLFAVWWLQKDNRALLVEMKIEREKRISTLEERIKSCEADRLELHKQVDALKNEVIAIYKSRDARTTAALNIPLPTPT